MRVGAWAFARLFVVCRGVVKSLDRIEAIEQKRYDLEVQRLLLDHPEWERAGRQPRDPKRAKKAEIGVVDVEELNKNWRGAGNE